MNLRWLRGDYIDPELNLTAEQRRQVTHAVSSRFQGTSPVRFQIWMLLSIMFLFFVGLTGVSASGIEMLLVAPIIVILVLFVYLSHRRYARLTWLALNEKGYDVCTQCGSCDSSLGDGATQCTKCRMSSKNVRGPKVPYVDPAIELTEEQRYFVRSRIGAATQSLPAIIRWLIVGGVLALWAIMIAGVPPHVMFILVLVAMFMIGGATGYYFKQRLGPTVWSALRELGYDVCTHCGYWLRGLGDDVKQCPECGSARTIVPDKNDVAT